VLSAFRNNDGLKGHTLLLQNGTSLYKDVKSPSLESGGRRRAHESARWLRARRAALS